MMSAGYVYWFVELELPTFSCTAALLDLFTITAGEGHIHVE
jgi:hypothetical protein